MTKDNLRIRDMVKPLECEMCKEFESVKHIMFECVVARLLWENLAEVFDINITNFEAVSSKWLRNKKNPAF
jgi:hypothetical protein